LSGGEFGIGAVATGVVVVPISFTGAGGNISGQTRIRSGFQAKTPNIRKY
jgi:hypothetical protein